MKPSVILVTGAATATATAIGIGIGIGIADLLAPSRPTPA